MPKTGPLHPSEKKYSFSAKKNSILFGGIKIVRIFAMSLKYNCFAVCINNKVGT